MHYTKCACNTRADTRMIAVMWMITWVHFACETVQMCSCTGCSALAHVPHGLAQGLYITWTGHLSSSWVVIASQCICDTLLFLCPLHTRGRQVLCSGVLITATLCGWCDLKDRQTLPGVVVLPLISQVPNCKVYSHQYMCSIREETSWQTMIEVRSVLRSFTEL